MSKIKTDKITLLYTCPECGNHFRQPLTSIVEIGTAACCECDQDCELDEEVEVED